MLTIREAIKEIKKAKKDRVKGKILENFYTDILDKALSYQATEGEIQVSFDGATETELAYEAVEELFNEDYSFKRIAVSLNSQFEEDYEMEIKFDLDKPYKDLDSNKQVG